MEIVDDILTRIAQRVPSVAAELPAVEAEIRQYWGGSNKNYVRKTCRGMKQTSAALAHQRIQAIAAGLQMGNSLQDVFAANQISRASGFRLVKRKA